MKAIIFMESAGHGDLLEAKKNPDEITSKLSVVNDLKVYIL